jgi:hypothetical protein
LKYTPSLIINTHCVSSVVKNVTDECDCSDCDFWFS